MKPFQYIPALKYHFFTPIYDWFIGLTMPEVKVKTKAIEYLEIKPFEKVLDFGCGTATALILAKNLVPDAEITGFDVDEKIMKIAQNKVDKSNQKINLVCLYSNTLPFSDNYFDKIFSTWVFHHLNSEEKLQAFKELRRVLKPEGKMLIADWGAPQNFLMKILFTILQVFDNFETTAHNKKGLLPNTMLNGGFETVEEIGFQNTIMGTLRYWKVS
ncbi:methyltransferase domain-containing protein [Lacihabitans sp. LS3-19]|uniref:class I SAM-dependent methyltransferase n=1 Tax=Lacihabitans sp. LS3-19 TaxID=2487335 RepID=UPI0020CF22CF|nr:methyltransferase domain-containing protein [Lacihabitans sp. LS3-19]MCP9766427.1 methyltransferase domain-containing protein [Lacihabitans sp. LS3-19]